MSDPVILSANWDEVCIPRMGVAQLTKQAFAGADLGPLWNELMHRATDDRAGSGMAMDLSIIAQLRGDRPTGLAIQKDTLVFQRLYRSPCASSRPRLRVLALAAVMDIGGNTPIEFLLDDSDIELATYYVVPGVPLPNPMPDHDVAIVVAPDSDASRAALAEIETLRTVWPRPLLNLPANIMKLDRDRLYRVLSGIAGLEIPQTARLDRDRLLAVAAEELVLKNVLDDGEYPLIVRPIGSHAGFGLERIANRDELKDYLARRPETGFFISRYVNYADEEGIFRKYRLVVIDAKPYACHMAIADEWKVWYLNADMAVSAPNRLEEAIFMRDFDMDFATRHADALREIIARIKLDYFTIDCAEAKSGALLIFEADNTAIVHDMDPPSIYPYKSPQMRKIFQAVQTMFYKHTNRIRASAA